MTFQTPKAGQLKPGTRLRHYKGGAYLVVGSCLIEATLKPGILYQCEQGDMQHITWMRPLSDFEEMVTTSDGRVPRFVITDPV
jgi:hypothetical protein